MTDFVFPQDGDYGDAADFAAWMDHAGLSGYVNYGLDFSDVRYDTGGSNAYQFDINSGKAFVRASSEQGARSNETREGVVYEAFMDARSNIDFNTDSGVNYVWLTVNQNQGDDIDFYLTSNANDTPSQPGFKFAEIDSARETVEYVNQGQDLEPERLKFQGTLSDPASPSLGEQWFREDEGIHYVELPGGKQQVPVAREFVLDDFESKSLESYTGDTGSWTFDQNASKGTFALRESIASGRTTVTNIDGKRSPQPGDTISADVLIGSQYNDIWFSYGTIKAGQFPAGYYVSLNSETNSVSLKRNIPNGGETTLDNVSAPLIESEDEFVTVNVTWGKDGTHTAVITDTNGREIASLEGSDTTHKTSIGFALSLGQRGSGSAEVIFDNVRLTRPIENHVLDSQDTLFMGGEQTSFEGAVSTGPLNAPEDAKGVHTDQPVTDGLAAGDEVGYLLGIGANDILDVYGEADGSGGVQNLAAVLRGDAPLRFEDENGDIVELRADGGELIVEDSAGNTSTLS